MLIHIFQFFGTIEIYWTIVMDFNLFTVTLNLNNILYTMHFILTEILCIQLSFRVSHACDSRMSQAFRPWKMHVQNRKNFFTSNGFMKTRNHFSGKKVIILANISCQDIRHRYKFSILSTKIRISNATFNDCNWKQSQII